MGGLHYDVYGNSAGQDNIGQILTAIISFQRLKANLREEYLGGLLLIDELEVTLFPGALFSLLAFLLKQAGELNIQIIFTSHSLDVLKKLQETSFKRHSSCIYIDKSRGKVRCQNALNEELSRLEADLKQEVYSNSQIFINKTKIWVEDDEARVFLRNITSSNNLRQMNIVDKVSLGCGNLLNLVQQKIPEFSKGYSVIVLDGDAKSLSSFRKMKPANKKHIVFLPTNQNPESVILNFLKNLNESDEFWDDQIGGYTKEIFIRNLLSENEVTDRVKIKEWFNKEKQYWGRDCKKVFSRWAKDNEAFINEFNETLERLLLGS